MPLISRPSRKTVLAATTGAAAVAAGPWWFGDRAPYPYSQRRLLELPFLGCPIWTRFSVRAGGQGLHLAERRGSSLAHLASFRSCGADWRARGIARPVGR